MKIDFSELQYSFINKPLLVGGKAMEYYDLRRAGNDIDCIVSLQDYKNLAQKYPEYLKDLYGDLGVIIHGFELWKCILLYHYEDLIENSIEEENVFIISLEKLLFMKTLAIHKIKYENDVRLIVKKILKIRYNK